MQKADIESFTAGIRGPVIGRNDADYDTARSLYNGMIDKRPRWIVRCIDADDVARALAFARAHGVLVAIRGGGHNGPGLGSCDDGLVIDLSPMKRVEVDAAARTVTVEPGCTQGEVDAATSAHGLAVPAGIVSTTGIAGLTLGGGHGYLSRKHGLTIDNLLAADLVLADGRRVTASESENADLLWGIRGGGGNFGVVLRFRFRAHPASSVYAGPIFWRIEDAPQIMAWYNDFLPTAPRELCPFLGLKTVPSCDPFPREIWGVRICALISCYNGMQEDGEAAMRPVRDELPAPILDGMGQMPFKELQALFDPLLPKGLQWYWKGDFVDSLTEESIAVHVEHARRSPSELSLMHLYPIDGAVHEISSDATAWGARDSRWSMVISGIDADPGKADELARWAKDYWAVLHGFNRHGGAYVNFMMDDEGSDRIAAAYGPNHARLRALKRKYDPDNLFRVNQNIEPAAVAA